jgi:hypothetical protein
MADPEADVRSRPRDRIGVAAGLRASGDDGPITVVTFRSSGGELAALSSSGRPFFKPLWPANMVGMTLDADTDWAEVAELLTESYRVLAPKKLAGLVG